MAADAQLEKTPLPGQPLNARLNGIWTELESRWNQLTAEQRKWSYVAAGLIAATLAALLWYGTRTDWRLLMTDLDPEDARSVSAALTLAQIPYELDNNGMTIRVPAQNLDKARLATVAKGALKSGRMGFELFDKPNWVGSEFDEQVNYQRALEGELEHTVGSLSDVSSARVHLVMPHDSLFREQERPAKASVVLKLRRRNLEDGEPDAIRKLVASAVDGLSPERVVLVDADGRAQLGPRTADAERLAAEQSLEEKLVATFEPVTGVGNVRASVTLDYDPAAVEETAESYDPDQTVTLSTQRSEQSTGPQAVPAGVPGTASNAPNSQAVPVYPQQMTPPASSKTEASTFGSSKTLRHSVQGAGRIRRLTAAILVNDRLSAPADKNKPSVWQVRSADDLKNLTALAQASVGFDPARGDQVTVEDMGFDGNARPLAAAPWYEKILNEAESSPQVLKFLALILGFVVLVGFGIRPALSRSVAAPRPVKALPKAAGGATVIVAQDEPRELTPEELERQRAQKVFDQVSEHLKREPNQSSRLLQSWIHSE